MVELYQNSEVSTTTQHLITHKNTNDYTSAIALLILKWIQTRPTGNLRLSLIHSKWLHIKPSRFTRSEIKSAINLLAKLGFITIQVAAKNDDLILTLHCQHKK